MAIVHAHHQTYPEIADVTAGFVYSRLQRGSDDIPTAYSADDMALWAGRVRHWAAGRQAPDLPLADPATHPDETPREVFVYFIHEGKIRAPQAAMELQRLAVAT